MLAFEAILRLSLEARQRLEACVKDKMRLKRAGASLGLVLGKTPRGQPDLPSGAYSFDGEDITIPVSMECEGFPSLAHCAEAKLFSYNPETKEAVLWSVLRFGDVPEGKPELEAIFILDMPVQATQEVIVEVMRC